jgi:hypothetical protein
MNKRTLLSKNTVILVRDFARRVASHLRVLWERQGREREGGGERGREKEREEETERPRKPRLKRTVYCELFPWCEAPPMHPADRMRLPALLPSTGNCSHGSKKTSFAPQKKFPAGPGEATENHTHLSRLPPAAVGGNHLPESLSGPCR